MDARAIVHAFIDAVEARDLDRVAACFSATATYQNVPYPPTHGPAGVRALLTPIITRSERVQWEVISEAYAPNRGHVERVDRFWIEGVEYAVPCHAVVEVDETSGLISEFRDYVDLGRWRATLGDVLSDAGHSDADHTAT